MDNLTEYKRVKITESVAVMKNEVKALSTRWRFILDLPMDSPVVSELDYIMYHLESILDYVDMSREREREADDE